MKTWAVNAGKVLIAFVVFGGIVVVLTLFTTSNPGGGATADVWTCSMHPQVRLPQAGTCPICGMKLIPLSQLKAEQQATEERASVETEAVAFRELTREIRTVGKIDYSERRMRSISARIAGRIDRIHADFTGIEVKPNAHLLDIYSPALISAQSELLRALEATENTTGDRRFAKVTLESARTKLQLLGILPAQIAELEKNRKEHTHLTIYAPIGGTIIEKMAREGMYVQEGDPLYRIAELDPIWLYLDIFEADVGWVRPGQKVDVRVEAYPGELFHGTVVFVDPFLNDQSRTVKVRVNLNNADRRLKPAMYASATIRVRLQSDGKPEPTGLEGKYLCPMHPEVIKDEPGLCPICEMELERVPTLPGREASESASSPEHLREAPPGTVLAVRASAVLDTGRRQIVYRKNPDGAFELLELTIGPRADITDENGRSVSYFPVIQGVHPGDAVVIRGGFMLDSQRQIEGMPSLLYQSGQSTANLHSGHGDHAEGPSAKPNSPSKSTHQH